MDLYEKIKALANEKSLSLNKVERDLSYPRNALSNYKQGKEPSARRLNELARYFSVSVDYLLGESNKKTSMENPQDIENLLDNLTDSRKNEVIRFLNEKVLEQRDEKDLVYSRQGSVDAIEMISANNMEVFRQGRLNVRVSLPFDEIPKQYDIALLLSDLNFPLLVRSFVEPFVRNGDVVFVTFPKGVYDPNITAFEFIGLTYIESTDKNGDVVYIRDSRNDYHGKKNSAIIVKLYHTAKAG